MDAYAVVGTGVDPVTSRFSGENWAKSGEAVASAGGAKVLVRAPFGTHRSSRC
jgi:hypothetical protein